MIGPLDSFFSIGSDVLGGLNKQSQSLFSDILTKNGSLFGTSDSQHPLDTNKDGYLSADEIKAGAKKEKLVGLKWHSLLPHIDKTLTREDYNKLATRYQLPQSEFDNIASAGDNDSSTISQKDLNAYIARQGEDGKGIPTSKIAAANTLESLPFGGFFKRLLGV